MVQTLFRVAVGVLLLALVPGLASAALFKVDADAQFSNFSDFSFTFDDGAAGDGLFDLSELTSFSGMAQDGGFFPTITRVPDIAALTVVSGACGAPDTEWCFGGGGFDGSGITVVGRGYWTYTKTALPSGAVPEPGAMALMVAALAAAGIARRHRSA